MNQRDGLFTTARGNALTRDLGVVAARILEFIHHEMADKSIAFDMETPIEMLNIDSIDVIHVIFRVEEEFSATVDLPQDSKFATVGDFVNALAGFVPAKSE